MFIEFLTPELFDALVIGNIVLGVLIAGRRFRKDIRGPLHEDAPAWARASFTSRLTGSSADAS